MMLRDTIRDSYVSLLAGDVDAVTDIFVDEPLMNTPLQGEVKGAAAFKQSVVEQQAWLKEREANPELFDLTGTDERIVAEFVLYLRHEGETIDLPVAVVADLVDGGISAVRVYHSTWPLTGEHMIRAPLLEPAEGLEEPEIIEAYMAGIGEPDKEAVLALFAEDGYVREPSGARYKHVGPEGLRHFYDPALNSGGVVLHTVRLRLTVVPLRWSIFATNGRTSSCLRKRVWRSMNWRDRASSRLLAFMMT